VIDARPRTLIARMYCLLYYQHRRFGNRIPT
jgi:hypothetical protein